MSLYVEWLNRIKIRADSSWLTKSQLLVYNDLLTRWQHQPFINLTGPAGCGKSFIARLLTKEHQYIYTNDLEDAPDGSTNVVVDNAVYNRTFRNILLLKDLHRIILITRNPITADQMPRVQLSLTDSDVQQFVRNLATHCQIYFDKTIPEGNNLEQIIITEILKRGESIQ